MAGEGKWVVRPHYRQHARLRLFCFSYAGGGPGAFRGWSEHLPADIEVCLIRLPGRESRIGEPPYTQMSTLVDALEANLKPFLELPFAFFGHSCGALVAFELARQLQKRSHNGLLHLIVSGCSAPQIFNAGEPLHNLSDDLFIEELRKLRGTPEEVLNNKELAEILMSALRADCAVEESFVYIAKEPLGADLSAFGGLDDPLVSREMLEAWRTQTSGTFVSRMFPGDHFFINSAKELVLQEIADNLSHHR